MSKIVAVRDGPAVRHGQANSTRVGPMHVSERQGTEVADATPVAGVSERPSLGRRLAEWHALPALVVAALTAVGVAIRVSVAQESMVFDELSTYWIISTNGLGGVVSTVHTDAEITPPLFFVAAWLTTQIDLTPELARLPSLVAGAAGIPVIYLLGLRTVGRPAALAAAALTTFSPFLIFYSAEARGYALMMVLVALSTLAMLLAVDTHRARWWVVYAACSCAAVYTHYTSVFALGAQFLWLLWAHPEDRKPALLANIGAAFAFLPWLSGMRADFNSPTTKILSVLSPFDWDFVWDSLSHTAVGYPYTYTGLGELPGTPALVLFALALILALGGLGVTAFRAHPRAWLLHPDRRLVLVIALALSVPVGEAIVSAVGTNIFGGRNLVAALPAFALCLAALLIAAGPRLRFVTTALALASLALGAAKMLDERYQRPNYRAAANVIDGQAVPGDVVIDAAVISPGPYSPLDVALRRPHPVFRAGAPDQRERPFGIFDRRVPAAKGAARAVAAADGGRIFVVSVPDVNRPGLRGTGPRHSSFPPRYRLVESHTFPGTEEVLLQVWADRSPPRG
jgi:4-amino-4-deoxy-L-arabinose transferase-like glycosyltransferase